MQPGEHSVECIPSSNMIFISLITYGLYASITLIKLSRITYTGTLWKYPMLSKIQKLDVAYDRIEDIH